MITKEDIEKLCELSRLSISESEKESMRKDIDSILGYVGAISSVNAVEEKRLPVLRNIMRDDTVTNTSGEYTEDLLNLAPVREGNYLKVKKILS